MFSKLRHMAMAVASAGVLAAAMVVAIASPASANVGRVNVPDVGVQFHGTWSRYTDAQRTDLLDRLRSAGITTVRMDVSWEMLQPHSGRSFDAWGTAFVDHVIAQCNSRGITPLITLWLTPGWANGNAGLHVLPTNVADYARVARWAAARYKNRVAGWEVWNEENSPAFLAGADPLAYTRLLQAAYPAFHAGYPGTTVVFGGLEYNDDGWIARAYAAGAHGFFDVMATHPYMGRSNMPPDSADDGTIWTFKHAFAVRRLMIAHGDGDKSVWFTEFGWSTHDNPAATPNWELGVTEDAQARFFTRTIDIIRTTMRWVGKVYWYTDDDASVASDQFGQKTNYSIFRANWSPKPVVAAISAVTHLVG